MGQMAGAVGFEPASLRLQTRPATALFVENKELFNLVISELQERSIMSLKQL